MGESTLPNIFVSPSSNIGCTIADGAASCAYLGEALWEAGQDGLPNWADGLRFEFSEAGCADGTCQGSFGVLNAFG